MTRMILIAFPLLVGCAELELGYPDSDLVDWDDAAGEPFALLPACNVGELEPNDGGSADALGVVMPTREAVLCGELTESGLSSSGEYTGDVDVSEFLLLEPAKVLVTVTWAGPATLDLHVYDQDAEAWNLEDTGDGEVLTTRVRQDAGPQIVAVTATDGPPTAYTLTVTHDGGRRAGS